MSVELEITEFLHIHEFILIIHLDVLSIRDELELLHFAKVIIFNCEGLL